MRKTWLIVTFFMLSLGSEAQRCLVDHHIEGIPNHHESQFENWISGIRLQKTSSRTEATYTLPIVFHIVHFGEEIGTGSNISDERILDQLRILNEDYGRTNTDASSTPPSFLDVAVNTDIQFILAKRDPEGLPTTGIVRKQGSQPSYSQSEFIELMQESFWPPEEYINIMVAELSGNIIGWSSYPYSSLEGIIDIDENPFQDAVIVDHEYIGINDDTGGQFDSFGRTLTHEIGHYLGLRHLWGDILNCTGNDYCDDTPTQSRNYTGLCPSEAQFTCESEDMYSNYMNYTNDACMNIFTQCQKTRMNLVLENSPRRFSLLSSPALSEPVQVSNDLGIRRVIEPESNDCNTEYIPSIEVRNYGTNTINSFRATLSLGDDSLQTIEINSNLELLESEIISFDAINISMLTDLEIEIITVNGNADGNEENNLIQITFPEYRQVLVPYSENFMDGNGLSMYTYSGTSSKWMEEQAPYETLSNVAASIDLADNSASGDFDYLVTPILDVTNLNSADLEFSYAYSGDGNIWNKDGFIVALSVDCGQNYEEEFYVFEGFGSSLRTTVAGNPDFTPGGPQDWQRVNLNITPYLNGDPIRVAFIGINGGGGKLYLDSISINPGNLLAYDVGIKSINGVPLITCNEEFSTRMEIANYGFETLDSYEIFYGLSNQTTIISHPNTLLESGQDTEIFFSVSDLETGEYELNFIVDNPNGTLDEDIENNVQQYNIVVNDRKEGLPLRLDFENGNEWIPISRNSDHIFEEYEADENQSLVARITADGSALNEHWLISPILDPNEIDHLGMSFRYAYKQRSGFTDNLKVVISEDCGENFSEIIFDASSGTLSDEFTSDFFEPAEEDWQEVFLDLSEYTEVEELRVAFVYADGGGSSLYLDDIEFFNTTDTDIPRSEQKLLVYPNPSVGSFNAVLNLPAQEPVTIYLLDLSGNIKLSQHLPFGLNQVINFENPGFEGIYFLRVLGKNTDVSQRIILK